MAWKTVATVMIIVFGIGIIQIAMAGPLTNVSNSLNETGDYDNRHFDGNDVIIEMPIRWFDMGLLAIFGIIAWGTWTVIRNEIFEGRDGL